MKPFNIEKAKNGAAVCLRDGTPVKILDFDFRGKVVARYQETYTSGKKIDRLEQFDHDELYMVPVYGYMNVFKHEGDKVLVGGVIRATYDDCLDPSETDQRKNETWFCVARVELLDEGEGGNGHDFFV